MGEEKRLGYHENLESGPDGDRALRKGTAGEILTNTNEINIVRQGDAA